MKKSKPAIIYRRRLTVSGAILSIVGLTSVMGAEPTALQKAEEAAKAAVAEEEAARVEWDSREMARSATREIARSERKRSEDALQNFLAGQNDVGEKLAAAQCAQQAADAEQDADKKKALLDVTAKASAQVTAGQQRLEQAGATMRAVADRLLNDSRAADQAASELVTMENTMRDKMAATRAAERTVLELKAQCAEKAHEDAAQSALQALTAAQNALKADGAQAGLVADGVARALKARDAMKAQVQAAWRAVREVEALAAWERQLWAEVQKSTGQQFVEQTHHAAQIATKMAAAETDADRKKALEQFAEEEGQAKGAAEKLIADKEAEIEAAVAQIYPLRAAAMGGLKPLSPEAWGYAQARHLLVRAGFGGTPQEVDKLCAMGLYKAVDYLVDFHRQPPASAWLDAAPPSRPDPLEEKLRNNFVRGRAAAARRSVENNQFGNLRQWWLERMVASPRPLQEKLTLFWHGHFATQQSVVQNSYTLYHQNQLFREHAAGNFGGLLYGIVHDPVMIRYLDNHLNVKGHANENLAREIMELFAMGVDQGYTEADIREAARALTGYTYDHNTGQFRLIHGKHDPSEKTVFGKKGNWTGDDLVTLILEQPSCARFIAHKLFEFFVHRDPEAETVESLASVLRANHYELRPMLKNLFLSEAFYSDKAMGTQIKSPVQLVVGLLRDLGLKEVSGYGDMDGMIQEMGQQLFEPPDVKGWRGGRSWISANRLFIRYNSAANLVRTIPQPGRPGVDMVGLLEGNGCHTASDVVDHLAKICFVKPATAEQRQKLIDFLGALPAVSEWSSQRDEINSRLQSLLVLMISTPEYQMT